MASIGALSTKRKWATTVRMMATQRAGIEVMDLERAVHRLSPSDQSLLAMRFAGGLDSAQIGQQSGLTASGVRSRIARLLERLRSDLDDA